ncbi:MAG TPA: energy transducer TonB, partial [Longimicrobium sp.]|nr:energy transducer TonB [Longimicrobium sp.]
KRFSIGAALALASTTPLVAQREAAGAFHAASCPIPASVRGYPVTVRAAEGAPLDSAFAHALADSIARRWQVPAPGGARFPGADQAERRLEPPMPIWADDWRPGPAHLASFEVTLYRVGPPEARLLESSTDRVFNASLATIFDEERARRRLPPIPADAGDSLRVRVGLGMAPQAGDGVVWFAAQQSPARVVPGSLEIRQTRSPWGGNATGAPGALGAVVRYDIGETGRVDPGSIQILRSSDAAFGRAVRAALQEARFTPAQANCRVIPRSVVQTFGRI